MKNEIEKLKNENKENKENTNQKKTIINLEKDIDLCQDKQLINIINKRFEELEKKYELIKKENFNYKNASKKMKKRF